MRTNGNQKEQTPEEQFNSAVGNALENAFEELESEITGINLEFADNVRLAAGEHGMGREQIYRVLAGFAGNNTDIGVYLPDAGINTPQGLRNVIDAFRAAYTLLLGEGAADRLFALTQELETLGPPEQHT